MVEKCPSRAECLRLMDRHQMLPNIREHSFRVMEVAQMLGEALARAGVGLQLPLLEAGALLHDIAKTACLQNGGNHAGMGAEWLRDYGYPAVAEIIREHVYISSIFLNSNQIREAEVVNYADKRVLHTQVVPLAVRFADGRARYGRDAQAVARIKDIERRTRFLEEKLFAPLSITPQDLHCLNQFRR